MYADRAAIGSGPQEDDADVATWSQFATAGELNAFCAAWLALQCRGMESRGIPVRGAAVLWRQPDTSFAPAAVWPSARHDVSHLAGVARQSLAEGRGLCERGSADGGLQACIAYPVVQSGTACGVAVLDLRPSSESQLQQAMRLLHWGAGWLENKARQQGAQVAEARLHQALQVIDLLGAVGEQDALQPATMALVNELASRLGASRVLAGVVRHQRIRLAAVSHVSWFDRRTAEVDASENVMEEALDQGGLLRAPAAADQPFRITVAHEERRKSATLGAVCSVVLPGRDGPVGVLTAEWPADADPTAIATGAELLEAAALLCGPVFEDKLDRARWLTGRAPNAVSSFVQRLTQRGHATLKIGMAAAVAAVAVLAVAEQDYRVTAKAVIEGEVQRAAVAPFRGYVASAPIRAGAQVAKGQVLAVLDERDLRLEQVRWTSEREQAAQKYHDALAKRDRATAVLQAAQQRQAQAQLDLVDEKLARATIRAPIAGLVVSGDLSQLLDSPVDVGQTLFEIAPLDAYRVALLVDDRDIAQLQVGQTGQLVLTGLTKEPLPLRVTTVTAMAEQREGVNVFRVEAELTRSVPYLRPGMEGVGKVTVGERSVLWVWTHSFTDWLRLALWRWLP
jgi:multidrug resistance efflux pump